MALRAALDRQHDDAVAKSLLFVTDGKSDAAAALAVAERDERDVRVFTLGVGTGVDRPLLAGMLLQRRRRRRRRRG